MLTLVALAAVLVWLAALTVMVAAGTHLQRRPAAGAPHQVYVTALDGHRTYVDCRCALGVNHPREL